MECFPKSDKTFPVFMAVFLEFLLALGGSLKLNTFPFSDPRAYAEGDKTLDSGQQ